MPNIEIQIYEWTILIKFIKIQYFFAHFPIPQIRELLLHA